MREVDPAPLGLSAFALPALLLSVINAGLAPVGTIPMVIAAAWIGGALMIAVGFWEFRISSLFAGVALSFYGAFWIFFAVFQTYYARQIPPKDVGIATAYFLIPWILFTVYIIISSVRTNVALFIVFLLAEILLVTATIGYGLSSVIALRIAGWSGIALALDTLYIAASAVLQTVLGREILPLGAF